eukprot:6466449-Amphidinium_carterae.1
MAATTEQVRELVSEMQRMDARLQAAEQAAADAGTRVQQAEQTASAAADQAAAAQRQQMAQGGRSLTLQDWSTQGVLRHRQGDVDGLLDEVAAGGLWDSSGNTGQRSSTRRSGGLLRLLKLSHREKNLDVKKAPVNVADALAKPVASTTMNRHLKSMGFEFRQSW